MAIRALLLYLDDTLLDDRGEVIRVLERGAERARAIAGPVLREAQDAMGLQL